MFGEKNKAEPQSGDVVTYNTVTDELHATSVDATSASITDNTVIESIDNTVLATGTSLDLTSYPMPNSSGTSVSSGNILISSGTDAIWQNATTELSVSDMLGGWTIEAVGPGGLKLSWGEGEDKVCYIIPAKAIKVLLKKLSSMVIYGDEE